MSRVSDSVSSYAPGSEYDDTSCSHSNEVNLYLIQIREQKVAFRRYKLKNVYFKSIFLLKSMVHFWLLTTKKLLI